MVKARIADYILDVDFEEISNFAHKPIGILNMKIRVAYVTRIFFAYKY